MEQLALIVVFGAVFVGIDIALDKIQDLMKKD